MYQVLPLKYRPKNFDEIIGQSHITQTLKNAVKYGRIANSYLFAGPRGIGKTTTARILAKALNCTNGPTPDPCSACDQCKEIQLGNFIDVLEIDGASNRGIDEVRQLRERVKYAPSRGKYKVYIIDESHMLTPEAFNALLKTIEEPPKHVVFILATTAPYKLPLTILSRCQRFNFRKISGSAISKQMKDIAHRESIEIEDQACSLIAQFVDGSLRDAISILDQLVPYANGKINTKDVQSLLGLPPQTVFFQLTDSIIKRDPSSILSLTQNTINQGTSSKELISGLINHFQTIFLFKTGAAAETESTQLYARQADLLEASHIIRIINFLFDTEKSMKNVLSEEIYLQQALLRISLCSQIPIDEILAQIAPIDVGTDIGNAQVSTPLAEIKEPITTEAPTPHIAQEEPLTIHKIWKSMLQKLAQEKPPLESSIAQATPLELNNEKLLLQCKNDFFKTKIEENLPFLEQELQKIANKPISIIFESPKPRKSLLEEPIVQTVIKIFNAKPVSDAKKY